MKLNKKPRVYAFIDSQNLNLGTQKMGWKMDWRKFREYLHKTYNVEQAYLFIGYMAENEAMYEQLHEAGYLIVLKRTLEVKAPELSESSINVQKSEVSEPERKTIIKGNIDAELVLYAMKELPKYDKAIVVSGDGDFYCLMEYLKQIGKLLHLMVPNWQYSTLLKDFESQTVRIDQLRRELAYYDHHKRKKT